MEVFFVFVFVFDHVLSLSLSVSVIVTPTCRGGVFVFVLYLSLFMSLSPTCRGGEEGIGAVELVANSKVRDLHFSRVRPAIKYLCLYCEQIEFLLYEPHICNRVCKVDLTESDFVCIFSSIAL